MCPLSVLCSFWLNASTGELFIREPINREMTAGPIAFSVIASDLDSNLAQRNTDTALVSVYGGYFYIPEVGAGVEIDLLVCVWVCVIHSFGLE